MEMFPRRHHSAPRTPYARLLDSPKVSHEGKERLRNEFAGLDPIVLRERIETKVREIFRLARRQHTRLKTLQAA